MKDQEMLKELCKLLGICTNTTNEKYLYGDIVLAINELKDSVPSEEVDRMVTTLEQNVDQLERDVDEYQEDIYELNQEIDKLNSEIDKFKEKNDRLCKDLIDSEEYAKTLSEELNKELNKKSNEIAALKAQIGLKQ